MSILKNLFRKPSLSPDDKIGESIKSIIEVCMEYVGFDNTEIEAAYVFISIEESDYVNYCFRINGEIIKKHKVNESLTNEVNVAPERQKQVLAICHEEVRSIQEIFQQEKHEMFQQLKITYHNSTKKMDSSFGYERLLSGTDLTPHDIEANWLKTINLG